MDSPLNELPPLDVPGLLRKYGLRPDKSLGQNFLLDPHALHRVVAAANVQPGDTVLEIGPGLGSLTRFLAVAAAQVVAVELDGDLLAPLQEVLVPHPNVRVVRGDILDQDPNRLMPPGPYIVVANIPYYITSAIIRHLLESARPPQRLVLTVQDEVARRICAPAGDLSLLALSVQVYGAPSIPARIPAGAFYPPPKVDSAVVRVDCYPQPLVAPELLDRFFKLAKAGFSQKRKTLRNSLAGGMGWPKEKAEALLTAAEIDPMRRAETLTIQEWGKLADCWQKTNDGP